MDLLQTVIQKLTDRGIIATLEYPGFINVPHPTEAALAWAIGTANPTWTADLMNDSASQCFDCVDFQIPSDSTDADLIAERIATLVTTAHAA